MKITPVPTPEEAAAIIAALETAREGREEKPHNPGRSLRRSRWRMAGLLGHAPPNRTKPGDSLWSYSRWEGMV